MQADQLVHQLAKDWQLADMSPVDRALCKFAQELTNLPSGMSEQHIQQLRQNGLSDAGIHDASQVVSYFNYINRIANSLDVDLEEDIHAWEKSVPDRGDDVQAGRENA